MAPWWRDNHRMTPPSQTIARWIHSVGLQPGRTALRSAITAACRRPEPDVVPPLLEEARLPRAMADAADALARRLAQTLRDRKSSAGRAGLVQGLLQEYALSSQEGVALMCLAEALLRIPDAATRDALIRDKISTGQWHEHVGQSPSLFVNAATWALLLTGKLVSTHSESGLSSALARLIGKGGEPLIRKSVDRAMRLMGEQFVTGETIADALARSKALEAEGFRYSYDMLGEAALTSSDAVRYLADYERAIHAIGKASAGRGVYAGPGISIKLSALHPRYSRAQQARVHDELYPVLLRLAALAKRYDIGLNIDAEEADRLELSLDLLERLCVEPELAGWNGIGFVVQAYQKRCPFVIDHVVDLARRSGHRLMVRLVKGAYWDSEIKRAQVDGLEGYPVYTRKAYTDVAYIACAKRLLAAPDAVYPQFATHNAHTVAAIHEMAGPERYTPGQYEFQCLHGMGEPLYEQVVGPASQGKLGRPCRIYAPVGTHETLLAYLVRRLAGERRQHLLREPHRRCVDPDRGAGRRPGGDGRPNGSAGRRRRPAAPGDRRAARHLRRRPRQCPWPGSLQRRHADRDGGGLARRCRRAVASRARCWRPIPRLAHRYRCTTRPTTVTSSARCRMRRRPTWTARWLRPRASPPPGRPSRRWNAPPVCNAPPIVSSPICRCC